MSEKKTTITKRKMTPEEIEIARKSVTQRKMTPEEIDKGQKYENLLRRVESSGKWWELWEQKESKEFFAKLKCEENVENAIKLPSRSFHYIPDNFTLIDLNFCTCPYQYGLVWILVEEVKKIIDLWLRKRI